MRLLLLLVGCGFSAVHNPDLAGSDLAGSDLTGVNGGGATNCRTLPLPCLDPADVIDVPSEMSAQDAFTNAKPGDTIQIRGLMIGSGFRVPSQVTLHGCEGAQIIGTIAFTGQLGTIEGFIGPADFYVGVDNLTNKMPPYYLTGIGAGSAIYNNVGRFLYAGVLAKF